MLRSEDFSIGALHSRTRNKLIHFAFTWQYFHTPKYIYVNPGERFFNVFRNSWYSSLQETQLVLLPLSVSWTQRLTSNERIRQKSRGVPVETGHKWHHGSHRGCALSLPGIPSSGGGYVSSTLWRGAHGKGWYPPPTATLEVKPPAPVKSSETTVPVNLMRGPEPEPPS